MRENFNYWSSILQICWAEHNKMKNNYRTYESAECQSFNKIKQLFSKMFLTQFSFLIQNKFWRSIMQLIASFIFTRAHFSLIFYCWFLFADFFFVDFIVDFAADFFVVNSIFCYDHDFLFMIIIFLRSWFFFFSVVLLLWS